MKRPAKIRGYLLNLVPTLEIFWALLKTANRTADRTMLSSSSLELICPLDKELTQRLKWILCANRKMNMSAWTLKLRLAIPESKKEQQKGQIDHVQHTIGVSVINVVTLQFLVAAANQIHSKIPYQVWTVQPPAACMLKDLVPGTLIRIPRTSKWMKYERDCL